ncbi:MAG: RNA-directed DNA polymerase, partial [Cyanothece sp. SIO1E1]|nr:RNA-directed DNA polymerase [Cyanothece sp. SIO1E1]
MKTTARFELRRSKELKKLFSKERLVSIWRKLVKNQMRSLSIKDLHDYYDFNYAIEARATAIIERILAGQYRAEAPLIFRVEKNFGICRHMMIPSPSDAVVFQVLTDALYDAVIEAQPSKGAYYARDRHSLKLPHEHRLADDYPWFILWPKFQKEIWKFTRSYPYLVTTDLANYFDNIGLRELRHVVAAITKIDEVYLDLLFSLIEDLSWTPDYLP